MGEAASEQFFDCASQVPPLVCYGLKILPGSRVVCQPNPESRVGESPTNEPGVLLHFAAMT